MYPHFEASLSLRDLVQYRAWCIPILRPFSALDIQSIPRLIYPHFGPVSALDILFILKVSLSLILSVQYRGRCVPILCQVSALGIQFNTVAIVTPFWGPVSAFAIQFYTVADVSPDWDTVSALNTMFSQYSGWCISISLRHAIKYRGWCVPLSQPLGSSSTQRLTCSNFRPLSLRHPVWNRAWCIPILRPVSASGTQFNTEADVSGF